MPSSETPPLLSQEFFDSHESDLRAAVPGRYAKRADREVVSSLLIPQLRAVVEKALKGIELPLGPRATDELCKRVNAVIHENRMLLDTDGVMKAMMPMVKEMRGRVLMEIEEDFKMKCREILAGHGVKDRVTLLTKGTIWFRKTDFEPYGKGCAFAAQILGRTIKQTSIAVLEEIADRVGFPKLTEDEKLAHYRSVLANHGVTDRQSLRRKGTAWFMKADFEPYGKGNAFAGQILGRIIGRVTVAILEEIADRVGFPRPTGEEKLAHYRSVLASHGVTDRQSLLAKGVMWFRRTDFEPYGKGSAFAGQILGRIIGRVTVAILEEIADQVSLPQYAEETLAHYRSVLANHGVTDRRSLLAKGPVWFRKIDFEPYGKGLGFAGHILGRTIKKVILAVLEEIADRVGFPRLTEEEKLAHYRSILANHGMTDRVTLLAKGPIWFRKTDFEPYGKGIAFAAQILGKSVRFVSVSALNEIADRLGW